MLKIIIYIFSLITILLLSINSLLGQNIPNSLVTYDYSNIADEELFRDIDNSSYVQSINSNSNKLVSRSNFKMKFDSCHFWTLIDGTLTLTDKSEYRYDNENLREIEFYFDIDLGSNLWVPARYRVIHFNKKGLIKKVSYNTWDGDYEKLNEETAFTIRNYYYDNNDNVVLYESQNYQAIQENRISYRSEIHHDTINNTNESYWYHWSNQLNSLVNDVKQNSKLDDNGNVTEKLRWDLNSDSQWELSDSMIWRYNDNSDLVLRERHTPASDSLMVIREQLKYVYNQDYQLKSEVEYNFYDIDSQEWNGIVATFFGYDNFGNIIRSATYDSTSTYIFDEVDLINQKKYEHNNDIYSEEVQLPGQNNTLLNENILSRSAVQPILKFENFSGGGSQPQVLTGRSEYFYSDISTSTSNLDQNVSHIILSPNPTNSHIKISIDDHNKPIDVSILNIQGQFMSDHRIMSDEDIDVSYLPNGIYFCKVTVDGFDSSLRFLKM